MPSTKSRNAARRVGAQRPQWSHVPVATDSSGAEVVDLAAAAGLHLDDWQQWVIAGMLGEDPAGRWMAFEAALIVPRQNGKNVILEAVELAGLFLLGERTIVHSAHRFDTCTEHFLRMRELVEGTPDFSRRLAKNGIVTANGKEAIKLADGARLKFVARQRGSGRGFTGNRIVFDEAYDLPAKAMGNMIPALAAKSMHDGVQVVYTSSAPHEDSAVLHGLRDRGRSDDPGSLFYAEWGNDPGTTDDDRDAWYRANPALGVWIDEEFVEKERRALESSPGEFARERVGIADVPRDDEQEPKIPVDKWMLTRLDEDVVVDVHRGEVTFGVDVDTNAAGASIAIGAGTLTDPYVELIEDGGGVDWLVARVVELYRDWDPLAIGLNPRGPAGSVLAELLDGLTQANIPLDRVHLVTGAEWPQYCGVTYRAIVEERLRHPAGQEQLDEAVSNATERILGEAFVWDRRKTTTPIAPLAAATIAVGLLPERKPPKETRIW